MLYADLRDTELARKLAALSPVPGIDRRFHEAAGRAGGASRIQELRGPWPVTLRGLSGRRDIFKYIGDA
ncbi:MAG: hypothetical protein HY561_10935 [Gemmatimonadetes bacterium]|nr:hypothetical protein [Gemmatimonadota bacterium]